MSFSMHRGRGAFRGRGRGGGGHVGRSPPRRRRSSSADRRESHYCVFCKVQLSSTRLFEEHKESAVHKQKEILIGKAVSDGLHYCYTCEKIFPSKIELDAHCLMSRHQPLYRAEEMQELVKQMKEAADKPPTPPVPQGSETEMRRARDDKDRQDIVMKLNQIRDDNEAEDYDALKNEERRKETQRKEHFCDICQVDCLSVSNYKIHIDSWRHRAEIDKKHEEERRNFEEEAERRFQESDECDRMRVPSHLTEKVDFFCEVCSVPCAGEKSYLEHLKGRKHLRQVAQMRRPFKCYFCRMNFNVEKEFNYHLESRSHMDKAFKKDDIRLKSRDKNEEWVEKKPDKRDSKGKEDNRDRRKDERDRRISDRKDDRRQSDKKGQQEDKGRDEKKAATKQETKNVVLKPKDDRKVEIVKSPTTEGGGGITDLREKLLNKKIVVTKPNIPENNGKQNNTNAQSAADDRVDPDKRAKELEFEAKFKKLCKEYDENPHALKERLTREREMDIATYQQYEGTYKRLCQEEDYVRENLRIVDEGDPRKEEHIRDMIRIQRDMREVRQELEIREMMIIKRESLFREKFHDIDNKVVIKHEPDANKAVVIDYNHGSRNENAEKEPLEEKKPGAPVTPKVAAGSENPELNKSGTDDLRIQLERERLLKRLGPELNSVDPALREKLLSVILDKDKAAGENVGAPGTQAAVDNKRQVVKENIANKKQSQMQFLTEREKQLEKELAELKSSDKKKAAAKSLVPQYDDVDDKGKDKKRTSRRRSRSVSSDSSKSSSSSSSSDSRYSKKDKKRRRSSPSKSRNKSKRSSSVSSDRGRKKRKRSTSRERDRKKKNSTNKRGKDEDRKRKSDRSKNNKKPVKITLKSRQKESKLTKTGNPLPGDSDSQEEVVEVKPISTIPVIGAASIPAPQTMMLQQSVITQAPPVAQQPLQRREQFSFWKNPVVAAGPPKDSPKEDVWDIAFSGGQQKGREGADTLNLFNSNSDTNNALSQDILNILKSVAPIIQNVPHVAALQRAQAQLQPTNITNKLPTPMSSDALEETRYSQTAKPVLDNNPAFRSDAGGRVRSILKKMKEPPASLPQPEQAATATPNRNLIIPGLDSTAPIPDRHIGDNKIIMQGRQDNQASRSQNRLDMEEKELYGGNIVHNRSYEEKSNSSYRGQPKFSSDTAPTQTHDRRPSDLPHFDDRLRPENSNRLRSDERSGSGSPWAADAESRRRRAQDDEMSMSSVGSFSKQLPIMDNAKPAESRLERPRERSPLSSSRMSIRYDEKDPYRPAERDNLRGPLQQPMDRLPPRAEHTSQLPLEREVPTDRRGHPAERASYGRLDDRSLMDDRIQRERVAYDPPPGDYPSRPLDRPPMDRRYIEAKPLAVHPQEFDNRPPVRRPDESDDQYYDRFERYYEMKRRREHEALLRRSNEREGLPPRRPEDDLRRFPDTRPGRDEFYNRPPGLRPDDRRQDGRFDEHLYRRPDERGPLPPDDYARHRSFTDREPYPRTEPLARDERFVDDLRQLPDDVNRGVEDQRRILEDRRRIEDDRRRVELRGNQQEDVQHINGRDPYHRRAQDERSRGPTDEAIPNQVRSAAAKSDSHNDGDASRSHHASRRAGKNEPEKVDQEATPNEKKGKDLDSPAVVSKAPSINRGLPVELGLADDSRARIDDIPPPPRPEDYNLPTNTPPPASHVSPQPQGYRGPRMSTQSPLQRRPPGRQQPRLSYY